MKLTTLTLAALTLGGAAALAFSASAPGLEGKPVEYTFRQAPVNALGIRSMADLRGKPIVIDFWGKN
ncbi:MAG: hypothetical protein IT454_16900 [Planctomycetes bacterium]|nr:hypothetical protein [Planctomycetota bacterium]